MERFVQSLKTVLKTGASNGLSLAHRLSNFLLKYRSSPYATLVCHHAHCFFTDLSELGLLRPNQESDVTDKQLCQKNTHDKKARFLEFHVGKIVMARNLRPGDS